ncbi:hypothetical protein [Leisingera sp. NJS201]|uniref:hypothetical protein n=1 Tax=Leisingera sp. NJS201 TaxID=2508306 RepID=UPI0020C78606|nr:hypothetical protein [Leisingera sp. NJS201]
MKPRLPAQAAAWGLILATILLGWFGRDLAKALDARWLVKWPSGWVIPFKTHISAGMTWLVEDAAIGPVSFTDATRALAWLIEQPYELMLNLLAHGFLLGSGPDQQVLLPAISWIAVTAAAVALGHYCRNWGWRRWSGPVLPTLPYSGSGTVPW